MIVAGMPVRADGRMAVEICRKWYQDNIIPRPRTAKPQKPPGGAPRRDCDRYGNDADVPGDITTAQRAVVCLILQKAATLPALLAELKAPVAAILAAGHLFDGPVWAALGGNEDDGGLSLRLWPRSGPPPVAHPADHTALIGRAVQPEDKTAANALLTEVDRFFGNPT